MTNECVLCGEPAEGAYCTACLSEDAIDFCPTEYDRRYDAHPELFTDDELSIIDELPCPHPAKPGADRS